MSFFLLNSTQVHKTSSSLLCCILHEKFAHWQFDKDMPTLYAALHPPPVSRVEVQPSVERFMAFAVGNFYSRHMRYHCLLLCLNMWLVLR